MMNVDICKEIKYLKTHTQYKDKKLRKSAYKTCEDSSQLAKFSFFKCKQKDSMTENINTFEV